jgi:hypothetical protein
MVVYNNQEQERRSSTQSSMVEEGAMMRERQTMIKLPDLAHMQVKCTIHESKVDSLSRGMRARVRVQDREFQGIVTSVANQPEPSHWFAGNVKEYAAVVAIESDPQGLRPGLTAAVEILVANLQDVLSVPVQSVVEQKGRFYCWVDGAGGPQRREVELGQGNNTRIQVVKGLQEGEPVLLNPRLTIAEAREEDHASEKVDVKQRFGDDKPAALPAEKAGPGGRGGAEGAAGEQGGGRRAGGGFDLSSLDKDGDKKISLDEAPDRMKDRFGDMDANSDGFLDAAEMAAIRRRMQQMRQGGEQGGAERGP